MKHIHRNRIFASLVATTAMLWSAQTSAATTDGTFAVSLTLVPACAVSGTTALSFGSYTAITGSATSTGGGFNVTCTDNLFYNVKLDGTGNETAGVYTYTDDAVDLAYTLTLKAGASTIASTTGRNGTAAAQGYTFDGAIASGQAGRCGTTDFTAVTGGGGGANAASCTNSASTNSTRTITVTY